MERVFEYLGNCPLFTLAKLFLNVLIACHIAGKILLAFNSHINEAMMQKKTDLPLYKRFVSAVQRIMDNYEKSKKGSQFYTRVGDKLRKSGYRGRYAPTIYLLLNYFVPLVLFIIAFVVNYPRVIPSVAVAAIVPLWIQGSLVRRKKRINLGLSKNIYKIYKYLHNQVSSGVKITDAIKTIFEVIEDRDIREVLVLFAARYELTMDSNASLEEFKSNFDLKEVDTLCLAVKQGIDTGDNREILARQEDLMFKKYFNYIQAETDSCRTKSILVVGLFTSVVVLMIGIPLINDIIQAVDSIFIN